MENFSKIKPNNDRKNSANNRSSINIKAKRISFSQESEISFYTKDNNKFFFFFFNKINIILYSNLVNFSEYI